MTFDDKVERRTSGDVYLDAVEVDSVPSGLTTSMPSITANFSENDAVFDIDKFMLVGKKGEDCAGPSHLPRLSQPSESSFKMEDLSSFDSIHEIDKLKSNGDEGGDQR